MFRGHRLAALALAMSTLPVTLVAQAPPLDVLRAQSSNNGLYDNRIATITPPAAYTEVCFKDGAVFNDQHNVSEPPTGGACVPGDLGWIIEQEERRAEFWEIARARCLAVRMRLPEVFEWKYSCTNSVDLGLNDMIGNEEWTSNTTEIVVDNMNDAAGITATVMGGTSCFRGTHGWIARASGPDDPHVFRCVR